MDNLDSLSEEQLDELLREAVEINQRLKSFERKQTLRAHGGSNLHVGDHRGKIYEQSGCQPQRPHFLPPIQQTKTTLVSQASVTKEVLT